MHRIISVALASLLLMGCRADMSAEAPAPETGARLFGRMGPHRRAVTTTSEEAQQYFDQGLTWYYAFNHDEAIRSFEEAARLDPHCAMAWWGIAIANGPHINNPAMTPDRSQAAWTALTRARAEAGAGHANPRERALIDALAARYAKTHTDDRTSLDQAYARAMRDVWNAYPNDDDIGCLYAEALMDLHPWDLWENRWDGRAGAGAAKQDTEEIVATLEQVLRLNPDHPGANHLYIHAVEASPYPERALAAADRLRTLVPASGHLVHMPAHIDVRVGRWDRASEANRQAIKADDAYRRLSPRQGFYRVYMAHNHHFLSWSCMMQGRRAEALSAARNMVAGIPEEFIREQGALVDPYTGIVFEAHMRFGRWDDILAEPEPPAELPITRALRRFARGVAFTAKGDVPSARAEQARFRELAAAVPDSAIMAINPAKNILAIAEHMLEGEIAFREKRSDDAIRSLRQAVAIEDSLMYMEPPDWIQPVRHPLGAFLLEAGRYEEAEQVYREDLERWPENGWALFGLAESLRAQGRDAEAAEAEKRFRIAWRHADTKIRSSCLCVSSAE